MRSDAVVLAVGLAALLSFEPEARAEGNAPASDVDPAVEVTVRDTKLGRASRRDPSAASTVVRREELERPGADAADVLARVVGVQVARSGSSADLATASLRGATSAQTPVYLAGIRLNDDVTGTADLSRLPLWMLDRVEVFRGSAPEDVDRLGIGGAVLFEPRLARRSSFGGGVSWGSFGQRAGWVGGATVAESASAQVALRREHADNDYEYVDDAGTLATTADDRVVRRPNADFDSSDAWAIGRTTAARGTRITTLLNAFRREQGVTGLGVIPARRARATSQRLLAGVSVRTPCSRSRAGEPEGECQLELSTSGLAAAQSIHDPLGELSLGASEVVSRGHRVGQSVHVVSWPTDSLRLRFGGSEEVELLQIDRSGGAGLRARRDVSRADVGARLGATQELAFGALAAVECHGTKGPGRNQRCDVLAPSGRVGAVQRIGRSLTLLGNLGRYLRVPTLGELFGVSAVVVGDDALSPERGVMGDVGARWTDRLGSGLSFWLETFAFARFTSDLIAYRRSTFGSVRPYNVGRARTLGLEASAVARGLNHFELSANATLLDPRDVTPGRQLANDLIPFQSRFTASSRLEVFAEPTAMANRIALAGSTRYRASRVADPAGLVVLGEQWTLGTDASAHFLERRLVLHAAVENLLDDDQVDSVGYPLPGRSYHASAELWW